MEKSLLVWIQYHKTSGDLHIIQDVCVWLHDKVNTDLLQMSVFGSDHFVPFTASSPFVRTSYTDTVVVSWGL